MKTTLEIEIETPDDFPYLIDEDGKVYYEGERTKRYAKQWHNAVVNCIRRFANERLIDPADDNTGIEEYYNDEYDGDYPPVNITVKEK